LPFFIAGVRTEERQRRARERSGQSLSLRTGQKLGIGAFAFFCFGVRTEERQRAIPSPSTRNG
ncbi:MAG TPA: hypothetical protein PK502_04720, partial [Tenuifilaceae bacterium]|nr:hypothetical protein [Tenuifilaceae bacterium]